METSSAQRYVAIIKNPLDQLLVYELAALRRIDSLPAFESAHCSQLLDHFTDVNKTVIIYASLPPFWLER